MFEAFLFGAVAGIFGTALGAVITIFIKTESKAFLSALLSFAAGVMVAVVCFDLFPDAIESSNVFIAIGATIFGAAVIFIAQLITEGYTNRRIAVNNKKESGFIRIGLIISFAIGLHNFPEGIIIGTNSLVNQGLVMALLIGLHDIPEGMAMAAPLRAAGKKPLYLIGICALTGLPTAVGAAFGYMLGAISPLVMSLCTAAAGGAMIYVVFAEMIPASGKLHNSWLTGFTTIAGILIGVAVINLL